MVLTGLLSMMLIPQVVPASDLRVGIGAMHQVNKVAQGLAV